MSLIKSMLACNPTEEERTIGIDGLYPISYAVFCVFLYKNDYPVKEWINEIKPEERLKFIEQVERIKCLH